MARGRKRKAGRRHPSGKLVQPNARESQREIMSVVIDARRRHLGVSERQAKDERLGTSLGRLAFWGKISGVQLAAGELYAELLARHRAVIGLPMSHPRSVTALLVNEGIFGGQGASHDDDLVSKVKRQAAAALLALRGADMDAVRGGRLPSALVHAVISDDMDASNWTEAELARLRLGLDALIQLFRVRGDRRGAKEKEEESS